MKYSTGRIDCEISYNGIEYEKGSVYAGFGKLTDLRKAKGKRYSLDMLLTIILMAKLCGENTPMEIAEWAAHRKEELRQMLHLQRSSMPHHNTYRRVLANKMYVEEIERLVGEYNQKGDHGRVYAMDGKAMPTAKGGWASGFNEHGLDSRTYTLSTSVSSGDPRPSLIQNIDGRVLVAVVMDPAIRAIPFPQVQGHLGQHKAASATGFGGWIEAINFLYP